MTVSRPSKMLWTGSQSARGIDKLARPVLLPPSPRWAPWRLSAYNACAMRILSVGWEIRGLGSVVEGLADAESFAAFDAVLLDSECLSALWGPYAQLERDGTWRLYQGRDRGLSRAMERLLASRRAELEALLHRVGGVVVVRLRAPSPGVEVVLPGGAVRKIDGHSLLPHLSLTKDGHYLALPQGIRILPRRGTDMVDLDGTHPLYGYLEELREHGYEAVIGSTFGTPLEAFGQVLARDRVGDVVAWALPVGAGKLVFVPSFPGADAHRTAEALRPGLGLLAETTSLQEGPDWLTRYTLPGEEALDAQEEELRVAHLELDRQRADLAAARRRYASLRALLYPRGARELAQAVHAALERLGFTCTPRPDEPRTLEARASEGTLVVRVVYAPNGPVGPEEHRALMIVLDRVRTEERRAAQGMLVVVAEPRLEPSRRPAQWDDAVRRGAMENDLALVAGETLFGLVADDPAEGVVAKVRRSLVDAAGEWRWQG